MSKLRFIRRLQKHASWNVGRNQLPRNKGGRLKYIVNLLALSKIEAIGTCVTLRCEWGLSLARMETFSGGGGSNYAAKGRMPC